MTLPPITQTAPEAIARWIAEGVPFELLDVRTPWEFALAAVPGARLVKVEDLPDLEALPRDTRVALLCHHGIRSQAAAEWFQARGFCDVHNIVGGIDAWSAEVDPSIPRY